MPQDRQSSFEPQVLPKRKKDISAIDDKIIFMYAMGMTVCQISETIEDIYGFEVSEGMVLDITDKLLPKIEEWQNRPLSAVYPIVFMDAVHFSVRDDGVIRKLAAYVVLGINEDGRKEVLTIAIGENESSKYWLNVLNSLKNRGIKDILILCSDGLTGIKEANAAAFPSTEQLRCIVHMIRANVETEIAPIIGSEEQAQDLIGYIKTSRDQEEGIWQTNIFGKSIGELVEDGIRSKITMMDDESQVKLQDTMQKIVNDSNGGLVCIII